MPRGVKRERLEEGRDGGQRVTGELDGSPDKVARLHAQVSAEEGESSNDVFLDSVEDIQETSDNGEAKRQAVTKPAKMEDSIETDELADSVDPLQERDMNANSASHPSRDVLPQRNALTTAQSAASRKTNTANAGAQSTGNNDDMEEEHDELEDDESESSSVENEGDTAIANEGGRQAKRGIVARLELFNFMCHDRLRIEFGPRLNFVIGHNGSGKSAILSGITLGLGAKASTTSRGSNVKAFIQEGKDVAIVEVVLTNKGDDGYRRDVYGDEIVIERTIRRKDNGSSWKIKSQRGKIVSYHKRELEAITDHYNIQVDNPVNVLTQDQARTFLTTSNPATMYDFFMRGTQLQHMRDDYTSFDEDRAKALQVLTQKRQGLVNYEIKAREARERYKVLEAALSQQSRLEEAKREAAWAYVKECEEELEKAVLTSERLRVRHTSLREELEKERQTKVRCERQIEELEARAKVSQERQAPLAEEHARLSEQLKEANAMKKELVNQRTQFNQDYKTVKGQITDIEKKITETLEEQRTGNKEQARLDRSVKQVELEMKKIEHQRVDVKDRLAILGSDLDSIERERDQLEAREEVRRTRVAEVQMLIRQLNLARADRLTAFGQNMPQLVRKVAEIKRSGGWRGPVVGPIGSHIKIKARYDQWAPVLESVIGNTLSAFCVTNHTDRLLLQKIKRELRCDEVSILTGPDEAFDYSSGEPDNDSLTILRILEFKDDFVRRQLINTVNIERSVLVEKREEGDRIFRSKRRNVRVCFTADLYRISGGEGGNSTQVLQSYKGLPRLTSDVETRLRHASEQLPEAEADLQQITKELHGLVSQINAWNDERRELRQRLSSLDRDYRDKQLQHGQICDELLDRRSESMDSLEAAKREFMQELERCGASFQDILKKIQDLEKRVEPIRVKRDSVKSQIEIMTENSGNIRPDIERAATDRLNALTTIQHFQSKYDQLQSKMDDAEARVKVIEQRHIEDETRAKRFGDRIETTKSSEELKKEIETIHVQIKAAQQTRGLDIATIKRDMEQRLRDFTDARDGIAEAEEVISSLDADLLKRWEKWQYFRRHISIKARRSFAYYMQTRGYEGRLIFKHKTERLMLRVKTEPHAVTSVRKDNCSLSGGEKSFSTICLLLSLWDAIGCPIRALDEFDVFMDAVNRVMSLRLIANAAKMASNTQFILITPLDITSNVDLGPEVRINRLADPKR